MLARFLRLLVVVPVLAGCNGEPSASDPPGNPDPGGETPAPAAVASPPTGIVQIEENRKIYRDDLDRLEDELGGRAPDESQRRTLKQYETGLALLEKAARMGAEAEAEQRVRDRYARLRAEQGDLEAERKTVWNEIAEIERILDAIEKGVGAPPAGFTEAELRDNLSDRRAQAATLDERDKELRARLKECEDLLAQDTIEPEGRTRFTDELEAIRGLQARVEELLAR